METLNAYAEQNTQKLIRGQAPTHIFSAKFYATLNFTQKAWTQVTFYT